MAEARDRNLPAPFQLRGDDPERRLSQLYRFVFQREPTADEMKLGLDFIAKQESTPWEQFAQVLLLTNEFLFVD